jgi:hypothetical protein
VIGVDTFIRTQKLRPILKINRLELWQENRGGTTNKGLVAWIDSQPQES